jgi:hypothetical protein
MERQEQPVSDLLQPSAIHALGRTLAECPKGAVRDQVLELVEHNFRERSRNQITFALLWGRLATGIELVGGIWHGAIGVHITALAYTYRRFGGKTPAPI